MGAREAGRKGGTARAAALPKRRRQQIARKAADARWGKELPRATHEGAVGMGIRSFLPLIFLMADAFCHKANSFDQLGDPLSQRPERAHMQASNNYPISTGPGPKAFYLQRVRGLDQNNILFGQIGK